MQPENNEVRQNGFHLFIAKVGRFLAWCIGLCLGFFAIGAYATGHWPVGIVLLAVGVVILPPILRRTPICKIRLPFLKTVCVFLIGFIALFVCSLFAPPRPTPPTHEQTVRHEEKTKEVSPAPVMEPKKREKLPTKDDAQIAVVLCQMQVKDSLKAPRTADFPWGAQASFNGKTATVASYVDAENSFGALIRTHYVCTVEYTGGKPSDNSNWVLKGIVTLD